MRMVDLSKHDLNSKKMQAIPLNEVRLEDFVVRTKDFS